MRRSDDVTLARRLAEALDGRAQPTGELEAIVRVLEAAAAEARFDLAARGDRAGARRGAAPRAAHPPPLAHRRGCGRLPPSSRPCSCSSRRSARRRPWTFRPRRWPRSAARARCSRWSSGSRPARGRVRGVDPHRAGSTRARGRAAWTQRTAAGTVVDQTLVERGRITRYDPATRSAVVARTCAALTTGCATAVDPVAVYRQALLRASRGVGAHGDVRAGAAPTGSRCPCSAWRTPPASPRS